MLFNTVEQRYVGISQSLVRVNISQTFGVGIGSEPPFREIIQTELFSSGFREPAAISWDGC